MSTSGVFDATADVLITCDGLHGCGWVGWVLAHEDTEDFSFVYRCGGCGHEETGGLDDEQDA